MPKPISASSLNLIDLFKDQTWNAGSVEKKLDAELSKPVDDLESGTFKAGYKREVLARYYASLDGKPLESFDPNGFLTGTLGMSGSRTAGRSNADLLRAFMLTDEY